MLPGHVAVLGVTPGWLRYRLPQRAVRRHDRMVCIGQKQVWFLLQFSGQDADVRLDLTETPEFDDWRWVDFWYPMHHVVMFKRGVYSSALRHLAPFARQIAGPQAVPQATQDPRHARRRTGCRPLTCGFVISGPANLLFSSSARQGGTDTTEAGAQAQLDVAGPSAGTHDRSGKPGLTSARQGVGPRPRAC